MDRTETPAIGESRRQQLSPALQPPRRFSTLLNPRSRKPPTLTNCANDAVTRPTSRAQEEEWRWLQSVIIDRGSDSNGNSSSISKAARSRATQGWWCCASSTSDSHLPAGSGSWSRMGAIDATSATRFSIWCGSGSTRSQPDTKTPTTRRSCATIRRCAPWSTASIARWPRSQRSRVWRMPRLGFRAASGTRRAGVVLPCGRRNRWAAA